MGQTTEELNAEIAGTRESLASDLDALQDRVSPSAIVERRKAAAKGRMRQLRSRVMGTVQSTTSSTGDTGGSMKDSAQSAVGGAVSTAEEKVEGSPLAAGLIAFGAGMLISALMPATETEARASQRLVDAAKEHGQPLLDEAKSMGQDVGAQLKDSAAQAAQEVKDTAQASAGRVQDEAKSSVQEVKSQAQN
jgi:ElaB/YqjD/DUF883 family membrane-anchored ribosome-binding protein